MRACGDCSQTAASSLSWCTLCTMRGTTKVLDQPSSCSLALALIPTPTGVRQACACRDRRTVSRCVPLCADWHFDNNWLTLTLMLQRSERGGALEVLPLFRCASGDGENFEGVARVLATDRCGRPDARLDVSAVEGVRRVEYSLGCLVLFKGRHSLHRATRVAGPTPRVIGILSYSDDATGGAPSKEHLEHVYGQTTSHDADAASSISAGPGGHH